MQAGAVGEVTVLHTELVEVNIIVLRRFLLRFINSASSTPTLTVLGLIC